MKKFFALVLSLVMALSLTTVAWGALSTMPADADDGTTDGVITLNDDVNLGSTGWTVGSGETVTLDLNGHAVSSSVSTIVVDGGTLTIKGNASGSKITTTTTSGDYEAIAVKNGGTLNFESGTVESTTHGIYAYSSGGTLNITGGKISVSGVESVAVAVGGGSATISGCNVISEDYYAVLSWTSPCTVTSGTFTGYTSGDNLSITGGTFSVMPDAAYVAHGYLASENPNGTWTVAKTDPMIFIDTNEFYTLKEAFDAAQPNDTITITKAGTYQWWHTAATLPDNLTVKGTVDGVVVNDSPAIRAKNITIDNVDFIYAGGNGATLYTTGDSVIKNCKIEGPNGTYYSIVNGKLAIDNCEITGTATYGLHIGEGTATVTVTNSKITGWNTYGSNIDISFSNCKFFGNDNYAFLGFYNDAEITDCEFEPEMVINSQTSDEIDIVIDDCTVTDGSDITEIITESTVANSNVTVDDAPLKVVSNGAGGSTIVAIPNTPILTGGAVLTPDFDKRAEAQYVAWDAKLSLDDSEDAKKNEFATYKIEMIAKINDAPIWWASGAGVAKKDKDVDFALGGEKEFVMVATEDQAEIVIIDGKTITYLARASRYNTNGWAVRADEVTLPYSVAAKYVCDTLYTLNPAATTFYEYNDVLYTASTLGTAGVKVFNVDGVAVAVVPTKVSDLSNGAKAAKNAEVVYTGHTYQLDSKGNTYKESELTKVYCDLCDTSFDFVVGGAADAIDKFGVNGYVDTGYNWPKNSANNVYVGKTSSGGSYLPSRPSGSTSTDKTVTSADTFDAGIAMYVGMSVMAAAGSAVVIGKKKD